MKKLALLLGVTAATLVLAASAAPTARAAFPGQDGLLAVVGSDGIATAPPNGADSNAVYGGGAIRDVAWSPSGTQLAFSRSTNQGPFQIWVVNLDGTDAHQVTTGGGQQPTWSADAKQIAYVKSGTDGQPGPIDIVNTDGTNDHQLVSGADSAPAWSPDGGTIAYSADFSIWEIAPDGTGNTLITQGSSTGVGYYQPNWSPDGKQLVFFYGSSNGGFIATMNKDGSNNFTVAGEPLGSHPVWSPDGTQIAFQPEGAYGVTLMSLNGTNVRTILSSSSNATGLGLDWQAQNLTLTPSKQIIPYHGSVTITTHLVPAGTTANRRVAIYGQPVGGQKTLAASGTVDASGDFKASFRPTANTSYTAVWSGDALHLAGAASSTAVDVQARLTGALTGFYSRTRSGYHLYHYSATCPSAHRGCPSYSVTVKPSHARHAITFALEVFHKGTWIGASFVGALHAEIVYKNRKAIGVPLRVRAYFRGDKLNAAATSNWTYLRITQ